VNSELTINIEPLKKLIDQTENREIFLLSVIGDSYSSNAIILNFVLKYLQQRSEKNWIPYDKLKDETLTGFNVPWENRNEINPCGLWIWNNYLTIQNRGREMAVILMNGKEEPDSKSCSCLLFPMLMSSCTILNFTDSKIIPQLDIMLTYGKEIVTHEKWTAFQKVIFSISNELTANDSIFGFLDFDEIMKLGTFSKIQFRWDALGQFCSEKPKFFVMPAAASKSEDLWNANVLKLCDLCPRFVPTIENFITRLFSGRLKSVSICGNIVKGENFKTFAEEYASILYTMNSMENEKVCGCQAVWKATSKLLDDMAVKEAIRQYEAKMEHSCKLSGCLMSDENLQDANDRSQLIAIHTVSKMRNNLSPGQAELVTNLQTFLDGAFEKRKKEINSCNVRTIQIAREDAKKSFLDRIKRELTGSTFKICSNLDQIVLRLIEICVSEFKEMCTGENEGILNSYVVKLTQELNMEGAKLKKLNSERLLQADAFNNELVERLSKRYKTMLEHPKDSASPFFLDFEFKMLDQNVRRTVFKEFKEAEKRGDSFFTDKYRRVLSEKMDVILASKKQSTNTNRESFIAKRKMGLLKVVKNYRSSSRKKLKKETLDLLKKSLQDFKSATRLNILDNRDEWLIASGADFLSSGFAEIFDDLESLFMRYPSIDRKEYDFLRGIVNPKKVELKIDEFMAESMENYKAKMKIHLEKAPSTKIVPDYSVSIPWQDVSI